MSIILPVYASGGISQFHRGRAQLLHGSSVTVRGYRHRACPRSVTASRKSLENKGFYRLRHCTSPRTVTVPAHSDGQIIHQTKRHPHRENDAIPARPNRMIRSPEPVAKQSETAPKSPSRNDAPHGMIPLHAQKRRGPRKEAPPLKGISIEIESARRHHALANWSTRALIQSSRLVYSFGICSVSSTIGTLALLAAPVI